jgi:hypothetical protein
MMMPPGYEETDRNGYQLSLLLVKSLYGLHQAGREWNKLITSFLKEAGFTQAVTDPCLFIRKENEKPGFLLLYVDDMIILALSDGDVEAIKNAIKDRFEIKDLGEARNVLGMTIERVRNGIYLGQPRYARQIVENADMRGCPSKPTPMAVAWEHDENSPKLSKDRAKAYYSIVMQLSSLSNQTRPDISFAVNKLSQFQVDCREHDWKGLMRVVQYIAGTPDHGLFYSNAGNPVATLHTNAYEWAPTAYADASFAEEQGRKSRSGHVFIMGRAAITWFCKKQPVVALSSTEAEYYSLSEAVREAIWVRQVFDEIGFPINDPTVVHQDNMSTMAIAMNPIQHQRVKHMDTRVHFIRHHLDNQDVKLVYCPTEDMVADILTKALPKSSHNKLTELLGIRALSVLKQPGTVTAWQY